MDQIIHEFNNGVFLKAVIDGQLVGSIRARDDGDTCYIEKLIVNPAFQNRGIGSLLLQEMENRFFHTQRYELLYRTQKRKEPLLLQKKRVLRTDEKNGF